MNTFPLLDFVFKSEHGTVMRETRSFTDWKEFNKEAGWGKIRPLRREWTAYGWPGGYPIYHVTRDGGILCTKCANRNLKLTLGDDPQWQIIHSVVNWEDNGLECDNCYSKIEAAYGEDCDAN